MLWTISALLLFGTLFFYRSRRRNRRNAAGQCAFCRTELPGLEYRVEGVWVCAQCARRTKRSAYVALILLAAFACFSVVLGVFEVVRDWRHGSAPDLWTLGLVLFAPIALLGLWWTTIKGMQNDNRLSEELEAARAKLQALEEYERERHER